jgi:hypothetical protein
MNISVFIFRDIDASGIYDLGDRPFAHIAVELGNGPMIRSNISGFANFRASAVQRDREIVNPGTYYFRVVPPPGWRITTGNEEQPVPIELLLGAPGDLIAADPADPVGLAPDLEIIGRVPTVGEGEMASVTVSGPTAEEPQSVALDDRNAFARAASPGLWSIETRYGNGQATRRRVEVSRYPVVLSTLPPDTRSNVPASRETALFDELIANESVAKIPSGYAGLNWHNWVVTHNRTYGGDGYINGTMSGEYVAYNGSGHPVSIDSENPFHFVGGYFTSAWADAEGETLHVEGWRGEQLVYEDEIRLSALGPVFFAADYRDLTRLEFFTEHYWQVVADDLVFAFP